MIMKSSPDQVCKGQNTYAFIALLSVFAVGLSAVKKSLVFCSYFTYCRYQG